MNMLISTENEPLEDYYGSLLTQHVKTILESGLLLDEDYEVLLKASNFKIYPVQATKLPLGLIASAVTTLGSVIFARRYDLPFVILPPLSVTIGLLCLRRKSMIKYRRHKEITNCLVQSLIKVQKLNASIIRYTKLRQEWSSKNEKEILLYNQNFEAFVKVFVEKHREYFKICLKHLEFLANLTNELSDDFKEVKEINVELLFDCDYSNFNNYLNITSKVQDVYVFLASKFLNYLALTFCRNIQTFNAAEMECLLNKKLLDVNAILNKLYGEVHKEFNNLRHCTSKKVEIDTRNRSLTRHVSGKLQETLISAVNNLSIIMEKSQAVLYKVESAENGNDVNQLESALNDLRDHAFATYESLDVLCRLYGIFSESHKSQNVVKTVTSRDKIDDLKSDIATLNFDDSVETAEENYELFIPQNDTSNTREEEESSYIDQSGVYLNLMLKELRHSLKQHERFLAARNKRGIKDEDEESNFNKEENMKKEKVTPRFNLSSLETKNIVEEKTGSLLSDLPPVPPPRPSKLPPPPPPPPNFNLSNLEEDNVTVSNKSLFENIRNLSSQLQGKEDIFGSDGSSDSD